MKPNVPQKIEPENWSLETAPEDDDKLPHPRGHAPKKVEPSSAEQFHYNLTIRNGGLVKERWRWLGGKPVFDSYVIDNDKP